MPHYRIGICCNLAGTDEEHEIEADCYREAEAYADELAQETFAPSGWVIEEIEEGEE